VELLPAFAVAYLGFPTVSYQIQKITLPLLSVGGAGAILGIKVAAAALLLAAMRLPALRRAAPADAAPPGRFLSAEILLAAACAAFTGYLLATAAGAAAPSRLEMSFMQGDWRGRNYRISQDEEEFFQGRIWSRRYQRGDASVDVLVTSTAGDRHRAHPPTYCLTGSGWEPRAPEVVSRAVGSGPAVPVTRLLLLKDGHEISFTYWFSDGTDHFAGYNDMLVKDMLARARGRRPDWFLFRVMTEGDPAVVDDFLAGFEARIVAARAQ
jgi:EpsI family protein